MAAPVVLLRSAVVLTGGFPALAGVDLSVDGGEVVALQGPNGAGKTTVLRLCAGLVGLVEGSATVLGCDVERDGWDLRPRVGFLSSASPLYDDLTVHENVRFGVLAGERRRERRAGSAGTGEVIEATVERLGLGGRLRGTAVGRLSTGQRRRVALAIVVARRPELFLLDEPHSSLDDAGRAVVDEVIADAAAAGAAVIVATHERGVAEQSADRVVTITGGRVVDEVPGARGERERVSARDRPGEVVGVA